jgi:tetratricopeptide (TPR) repeat protein
MNRKIILMALFAAGVLVSCKPNRNTELAERVYDLEQIGSSEEEPEKIREIRKEINRWEKELNDAITAGKNTGRYYRVLGLKFLDYKMFSPARDSFSRALEITPENGRLYYYRAVAVSRLAISRDNPAEKLEELTLAERDYLKAILLEPQFMSPYYSLAILYIYELSRPFEAEPYLRKYLDMERSDGRALLLYGQLMEQMGKPEKAMDQYTKLLALSGFTEEQKQAEIYLKRIREESF